MKAFLIKVLVFVVLVAGLISFILIKYGGTVDYFYLKFTVPKQTSMILGDSRSMEGIRPDVINQELKDVGFDLPMFNYSFTIVQISYGKPYTESIKRKLKPSPNGLFILNVNPWLFTNRKGDDLENGIYAEKCKPPNNMHFVDLNPNPEYFFKNRRYLHFRTLLTGNTELHKDGWSEKKIIAKDSSELKKWKEEQVNMYNDFAENDRKSEIRLEDFSELIRFLKQNGKVVLVRMPVNSQILAMEDRFWPGFDGDMEIISNQLGSNYFNFSKENKYQTYDGNHLDPHGAMVFTRDLCDSIRLVTN